MRVLIITNHYMDDNNGGANNSKAYIRALSELYSDCTLLYPRRENDISKCFIPNGVNAIPVYDNRSRIKKGFDIYRGILTRLPLFVKKHLQNNIYDIIVVDHSVVASGIISALNKTEAKIITIHHNDEKQYLRDNKPGFLYRWPQFFFAIKAEKDSLRSSDLNISLTDHDSMVFRERVHSNRVLICSVGTFQYEDIPSCLSKIRKNEYHSFAITGSLDFPQSIAPVVSFIKRYYPLLVERIPNVKLIVAGRNPTNEVEKVCAAWDSIELIPNPKDMQDILKDTDVYVCPIDMGSGVKLRVMDGLRQGLPILAHDISVNGYEQIVKDGNMFGYHDESSFKDALEQLLHSRKTSQDVYDSFYSYYSFEAGKNRLAKVLTQAGLLETTYDNKK